MRYLLAAIAALTLIMSVVSSVNPGYFVGLKAYADEDEENDDDNSGSSNDANEEEHEDNDANSGKGSDDEQDDEHDEQDDESEKNDDDNKGKEKDDADADEFVQSVGNNSKVALVADVEHVDLEVTIEDGDLDDGQYDVMFACDSPDVDKEFANALLVEDGHAGFETEVALSNGTYTGCEVDVGGLSATFPSFSIMAQVDEEEDDEEQEEENEDEKGQENEHKNEFKSKLNTDDDGVEITVEAVGLNMTDGSYDAVFACEQPAFSLTFDNAFEVEDGEGEFEQTIGLANGTYSGCDITVEGTMIASFDAFTVSEETEEEQDDKVEEKRKEKKERIVNTTSGREIHERHRSENAASPGEYQPSWNYSLTANGTAVQAVRNGTADVELDIEMAVWKSNNAVILLDVIDGTVQVDSQTYTVVLGYALYTIHYDMFRMGALVVDDDGNVFRLKLSGSAVDEEAGFPMESGSIELTFEGRGPPDRLGDWELTMDGTITAG